jgi:hypothetical protein
MARTVDLGVHKRRLIGCDARPLDSPPSAAMTGRRELCCYAAAACGCFENSVFVAELMDSLVIRTYLPYSRHFPLTTSKVISLHTPIFKLDYHKVPASTSRKTTPPSKLETQTPISSAVEDDV